MSMEKETKLTIKLSEDLLAAIKLAAKEKQTTVSALTRLLFIGYIESNNLSIENNYAAERDLHKEKEAAIILKAKYHEVAQKKRDLKLRISETHKNYLQARNPGPSRYVTAYGIDLARANWKQAIADYKAFCEECKRNKV